MAPAKKKATKKAAGPQPEATPTAAAPMMQAAAPGMAPGAMPGYPGAYGAQGYGMPGYPAMPMGQPMPGMQPGMAPGAMPGMGMAMGAPMAMAQNPMFAMMRMMQAMSGGGAMPGLDAVAMPFAVPAAVDDGDQGLDASFIRPATLEDLVKTQEALETGSVLDYLFLTEDVKHALGGLPKGCTIALAGPPGAGKTRTALAALARIARTGERCAFVVAEEGFHDAADSGRDDLASRMTKIGMAATGLDLDSFRAEVLDNIFVMESQYHRGQNWDDFVTKYRYLIESQGIDFVVVDSLNMLDPSRTRTADNLSALKTYNHEHGVTCLCIGQIRDTGQPVGGEALMHTADAVVLIEQLSLGSKEIAAFWGGKYRQKLDVARAIKCVTTPTFLHPVRIARSPATGELVPHPEQPEEYDLIPKAS
ncbi:MAG: RAD55 family ATPase [Planctomycetota bacterium]|jgi:KaiC/GvpD/RAD55 family RecA-like ATPase